MEERSHTAPNALRLRPLPTNGLLFLGDMYQTPPVDNHIQIAHPRPAARIQEAHTGTDPPPPKAPPLIAPPSLTNSRHRQWWEIPRCRRCDLRHEGNCIWGNVPRPPQEAPPESESSSETFSDEEYEFSTDGIRENQMLSFMAHGY